MAELKNNFFALEIYGISSDVVHVNCVDESVFSLNVKQRNGDQQTTTAVKVSGSLLKVNVSRSIGKHNCINTTLKLVEQGGGHILNISNLKETFSNVGTSLKVQSQIEQTDSTDPKKTIVVNSDLFYVATNYFIISVAPRSNKVSSTYYVDLCIYSQDIFLDMTKYSKVYTAKKLGGQILDGIIKSHKETAIKCNYQDMRVLRCKPLDDSNKEKAAIELLLPYVVQYNETEWNFLLRNANRCGEFLYFENGILNLGLTRIYEKESGTSGSEVERVKKIVDSDYSSIESLFDYQSANTAKCFYNNAINSSAASATPYVAEYSNDDCFDTFTNKSNDNYDDCKNELFFPTWSRVFNRLFQYKTLMSFGLSSLVAEMSVHAAANMIKDTSLTTINTTHFADQTDKDSQYATIDSNTTGYAEFSDYYTADGKTDKSKVGKIPASYRPNTNVFYAMREAEEAMAREQYRITLDNKQMEFNLGDMVTVKDISSDEKYVVVDVRSQYETIDKIVDKIIDGKEVKIVEKQLVNQMVVTVIPVRNDAPVPLPAETEPIRVVGAQTAVVVDNNDPQRLFRVRVKFSWQNDGETTPWIRVATPFATSDGSGFYCKPNVDDEVMVDFEYGNIERPFVVGSLFNNKYKPPYGLRKYSTAFRSNNGHTIAFNDLADRNSIFSSFFPGLNVLKMIPGVMTGLAKPTKDKDVLRALGGIEICDYYGLYSISASSDQRKIKIESPFGTIDMSAAMGININAPNGDISISGKNVTIEAGNNLTLTSGTNIGSTLSSIRGTWKQNESILQAEVMTALGFVGGLFDVPALRFVIDLLIKPINGTLTIHSGRYMLMEAGDGKAQLPADKFTNCQGKLDSYYYLVFPKTNIENKKTNQKNLNTKDATEVLIDEIGKFVGQFVLYDEKIKTAYVQIMAQKKSLKEFMISKWNQQGKENEIESIIVDWMTKGVELNDDDIKKTFALDEPGCKLKMEWETDFIGGEIVWKPVTNESAKIIKEMANKFMKPCKLFSDRFFSGSYEDVFSESQFDKNLKGYDYAKELFSKDLTKENIFGGFLYAGKDYTHKCIERRYVWALLDAAIKSKIVTYMPSGPTDTWGKPNKWDNDTEWSTLTGKLTTTMNDSWAMKSWAVGLKKTVNNIVPLDTFSSLTWKADATGEIIMSQSKGSSIQLDGSTFKMKTPPPLSKLLADSMAKYDNLKNKL